jgi:hypothetical protein
MGAYGVAGSLNTGNAQEGFDAWRGRIGSGAASGKTSLSILALRPTNHRNDFAQNADSTSVATDACHDSVRLPTL